MGIQVPTPRVDRELTSPAPEQDNPLRCRVCSRIWAKPCELERHEVTHSATKPHNCPVAECGKSFSQKTALQTHLNTHTGKRPHACRFSPCKITFGDPSSRTRHEKEIHMPYIGFKCPQCHEEYKRKEQFRKHYALKHDYEPTSDIFEAARRYRYDAYEQERIQNGDPPITKKVKSKRPASPLSSSASPPPRKRRNAIVSTSVAILDNEPQKEAPEMPVPQFFVPQPGHKRNESNESSESFASNPYYSEASQGSYTEAFNPAYPLPSAYSGAPAATLQYPARNSASPGSSPQGGYHELTPVMAHMPSPHYEHDITEIALEHLANGRIPTVQASVAPAHTLSGPTGGHYGISSGGVAPNPVLAMPEPRHASPIQTNELALNAGSWDANMPSSYDTRDWDGANDHSDSHVLRTVPRAVYSGRLGGSYSTLKGPSPCSRDNRDGIYQAAQDQGQPPVASGSSHFLVIDNTYQYPGSNQAMSSSESDTPPHPNSVYSNSTSFYDCENSAMPASLAGMHGARHD